VQEPVLDAPVARRLLTRASEFRTGDDLDTVRRRTPTAPNRLDVFRQDDPLLDLYFTSQVRMPILTGLDGADDVEARQVAAMAAPEPRGIIGKRETHAAEPTGSVTPDA
jgi:hypothetical protein